MSGLFQQKLFDKEYGCVRSVISIVILDKSVTLVSGKDVPDWDAFFSSSYKPRSFCNGHSRIILAVNDQQRLLDGLSIIERRNALEEFSNFWIAFVSELCALKTAPPSFRVLHKTGQV